MLDLESFVYSSPFGIGPVTEYVRTGQVGIDPVGYIAWGALGAGMEFAVLGTTKFAVYAPAVNSAFFGELGLFTVTGTAGSVTAVTTAAVVVGLSVVISKTIVDHTPNAHRTSFTGQMSGRYFDY